MILRVNVKVFIAVTLLLALTSVSQGKPKWHILFDGKSTGEWRGFRRDSFPSKCWQVEQGAIKVVGRCDKSDQIDIVTREKYRNFELELEWRVAPGANSGIIHLISRGRNHNRNNSTEIEALSDDNNTQGQEAV